MLGSLPELHALYRPSQADQQLYQQSNVLKIPLAPTLITLIRSLPLLPLLNHNHRHTEIYNSAEDCPGRNRS